MSPAPDPQVQIFGTKKNANTPNTLHNFTKRRIKTHIINLMERAASHV